MPKDIDRRLEATASDNLIAGQALRTGVGQVTSYPDAAPDAEPITYYDALQTALDAEAPTVAITDTVDGQQSKLNGNPFTPTEQPTTFFDGTEAVTPWVYDAENPQTIVQGQLYSFEGTTYICRQFHIANSPTFAPGPATLALFAVFVPPSTEPQEWVQFADYDIGDRVTWLGITYEAIQNPGANVSSPNLVPAIWQVVT